MPPTRTCPSCGVPLPAGAPRNLCPRCLLEQGFEPQRPEPDSVDGIQARLAERLPELSFEGPIGRGGMGHVFRARQRTLDRLVAVKVLLPELLEEADLVERFSREARALAKLHHPNIVGVYDFGRIDDTAYLVLEHIDGQSLREVLRSGDLEPARALAIVREICEALQYAHDHGVVHRDIKPENILVDGEGRVKIADFGLAKLLHREADEFTLTAPRQVMGTPRYMAPEQMDHPLEVDHRADIYSLGVVFYELLTGEVPAGRFDPPSKRSAVDARLDEIVLRTLEREPERRYQHASQVKSDVDTVASSPPAPRRAPAERRTRRGRRRGRHRHQERAHARTAGGPEVCPEAVVSALVAALALPPAILATMLFFSAFVEFPLRSEEFGDFLFCLTPVFAALAALGYAARLGWRARRRILDVWPDLFGLGAAHFAIWFVPLLVVDIGLIAAINVPIDIAGRVPDWLPGVEALLLLAGDVVALYWIRSWDLRRLREGLAA